MLAAQSSPLTRKFVDALYTEAMVLADETRTYFDDTCQAERDRLPPQPRVLFSCEALKVTTRLMHCVTWLLRARANADESDMPLSQVEGSRPHTIRVLPDDAKALILASQDLYERVARLEEQLHTGPMVSPVSTLMTRLSAAF